MYASIAEVRALAQSMTASAVPSATDDLVRDLVERVSRMIDLECGVTAGYFEPALYPVWEPTHTYVVGDIVTPTTPNAHKYRCTTAGTSGNTEPTFPASSTVTDGLTVVWTENGADVIATQRTFYGDGTNYLKLDPYVPGSLTIVSLPDGYTAPNYVERNGYLIRTGSTHVLPSRGDYSWGYGWTIGAPITITAKWGYESTPADIKHAVIEWAINVWRETDPAGLKLVGLEGQVLREAMPPRVAEILKFYQVRGAAFV